ncbi:hypothetical protein E4U43_005000 [Claviceps pusilla]|uniref:Protein ECM13 n=1 Tax=Claviceps pusilla TaxID=123648 RepID=A0A9P7N3Z9_9HYPO|nr:hypothetical protein E4U43_005000 [Claviceps pusilla]
MSTTVQPRHNTFTPPSSTYTRPTHKRNMSVTQTYYLAHKARAKLSQEAARPDHDLRLLVGHANLLDSLMLELVDAEREQERRYNQSVRGTGKTSDRHIQWADKVVEEPEEEYDSASSDSDSDSECDSDFDDDDVDVVVDHHNYNHNRVHVHTMDKTVSVHTPTAATPTSTSSTTHHSKSQVVVVVSEHDDSMSDDDDVDVDVDDDLQEDYAQLELVRTPSHASSPPELLLDHDSESSSDDESMPPSPRDHALEYTHQDAKAQATREEDVMESDYYISRQPSRGLVSAISVY